MLEQIPDKIDVISFAKAKRVVRGHYAAALFQRLQDLVEKPGEPIEFEVKFSMDSGSITVVSGTVVAHLCLRCQRCLSPFDVQVKSSFMLGAIESEQLADRLPDQYEPLLLNADGRITLRDVVEDELILAMPLIPKHAQMCTAHDKAPTEASAHAHPFAALQKLKQK